MEEETAGEHPICQLSGEQDSDPADDPLDHGMERSKEDWTDRRSPTEEISVADTDTAVTSAVMLSDSSAAGKAEIESIPESKVDLPDSTNPDIHTESEPLTQPSETQVVSPEGLHSQTSTTVAPKTVDVHMDDQTKLTEDSCTELTSEIIEDKRSDILSTEIEIQVDSVVKLCEKNQPEEDSAFQPITNLTENSLNVEVTPNYLLNTTKINFNNLECEKQLNEKTTESGNSQTLNCIDASKDEVSAKQSMVINICDASEKIIKMASSAEALDQNIEFPLKIATGISSEDIVSSDLKLPSQIAAISPNKSNKDTCNANIIDSKPAENLNLNSPTPVKTGIKATVNQILPLPEQEVANIKVIKVTTNAGVHHYIRVSSNSITDNTGKKSLSPTISKVKSPEKFEEFICKGCDSTLTKRGMYHPCCKNFCRFCQVALASSTDFELHTIEKHMVNMRTCCFCEVLLASLQMLEMHLRSHTSLRLAPSVCVGCRTMFRTNEGRKQHECGTPLLCRPCNVILPSEARLTEHQAAQHRPLPGQENSTQAPQCQEEKTQPLHCQKENTQVLSCQEEKTEVLQFQADKLNASTCQNKKTQDSRCQENLSQTSEFQDEGTQIPSCQEDNSEALSCKTDKMETSTSQENEIQTSEFQDEGTQIPPCQEDTSMSLSSTCQENLSQTSEFQVEGTQIPPCQEDKSEALSCKTDNMETSTYQENEIQTSEFQDEGTQIPPCQEDKSEALSCKTDKMETSTYQENEIQTSEFQGEGTQIPPCQEDKSEALSCKTDKLETSTYHDNEIQASEFQGEGTQIPPCQEEKPEDMTYQKDTPQLLPWEDPVKMREAPRTAAVHNDTLVDDDTLVATEILQAAAALDHTSDKCGLVYQCDICDLELPTEAGVLVHRAWHFESCAAPPEDDDPSSEQSNISTENTDEPETKVKCLHCDLLFSHVSALNAHLYAEKFCKLCPLQLGEQPEYEQHMVEYHSTEKSCQFCGKEFRHSKDLWSHLKSHTQLEFKPFQCRECKTAFNKTDYLKHNKCRAANNSLSVMDLNKHCDKCKIYFQSDGSLENHMIENHSIRDVCPICNKRFLIISELITHFESHSLITEMSFKCQKCQKYFNLESEFDEHECLIYVPSFENDYNDLEISQSQFCSICKDFFYDHKYEIHMMENHCTEKACQFCGQVFASLDILINHLQTHTKLKHTWSKSLQCDSCKEQFSSEEDQLLHECEHEKVENTPVKNFCQTCDITFETCSVFEKHMMDLHSTEDTCQFCSKKFSYPELLVTHMQQHTKIKHPIIMVPPNRKHPKSSKAQNIDDEEDFNCIICNVDFANKKCFELHMMKEHSSEKKCQFCNVSFEKYEVLKQHIRLHTSLPHQPFKCPQCDDSFSKETNLVSHQCLPRFTCDMCQLSFRTQTCLNVHFEQDHELTCQVCHKQFKSQRSFNRHIRSFQHMSSTSNSGSSSQEYNLEINLTKQAKNPSHSTPSQQKQKKAALKLQCSHCPRVFLAKHHLANHLVKLHKLGTKKLKCKICQLSFKSPNELNNHECKDFFCKRCETYFIDRLSYDEHMIESHSSTDTCQYCDKKFKNMSALLSHVKTHTTLNFTCEKGTITFHSKKLLDKHASSEKKQICQFCKKGFKNIVKMKQHVKDEHSVEIKCKFCLKCFVSNRSLAIHVVKFHELRILEMLPVKCRRCSIQFGSSGDLGLHSCLGLVGAAAHQKISQRVKNRRLGPQHSTVAKGESPSNAAEELESKPSSLASTSLPNKRKHTKKIKLETTDVKAKDIKSETATKGSHLCVHCNLLFDDNDSLNIHLMQVKFCKFCKKTFYNRKILEAHMVSKHNLNKTCQYCDRVFKGPKGLARHITIHTKLKYVNRNHCHSCDKSFSNRQQFEVHMMAEHCSDSKCQFCNLTFTNKNNLVQHMKKHTQLKHQVFYKCLTCNEKFNNKIKKKYHKCKSKTVSSIKTKANTIEETINQLCSICNKSFISQNSFQCHMIKEHFSSASKKCPFCGLYCRSNVLLLSHIKEHAQNKITHYKCSVCEVGFSTASNLKSHSCKAGRKHKVVESEAEPPRKRTRQTNPVKEETPCPPKLTRRVPRRRQGADSQQPGTSSAGGAIRCSLCTKTFPNFESKMRHLEDHHRVNINSCDQMIISEDDKGSSTFSRETQPAAVEQFGCNHCDEIFLNFDELQLHGKKARVFCEFCRSTYPSQADYRIHMLETHSKGITCQFCGVPCSNVPALMIHLRKHTRVKPTYFKCCNCEEKYDTPVKYKHHTCLAWGCDQCDMRFATQTRMQEHAAGHHVLIKFQCEFCHHACTTGALLAKHMQANHAIGGADPSPSTSPLSAPAARGKRKQKVRQARAAKQQRSMTPTEETEGVSSLPDDFYEDFHSSTYPTCGYCSKILPTALGLKNHMEECEQQHKIYKCGHCDKQFDKQKSLSQHLSWHVRKGDLPTATTTTSSKPVRKRVPKLAAVPKSKPASKFLCSFCGKRTSSAAALHTHQLDHGSQQCELCYRVFETPQQLSAHLRLHPPPPSSSTTTSTTIIKEEVVSDDELVFLREVVCTAPQGQFVLMN